MNNMIMREEIFLDEAYKLLQAGYDTIHLSKDEFKQQIEKADTKNYLDSLTSNSIIARNFEGWMELPSILKEGLRVVRYDNKATTCFDRGHKILRLRIETEAIAIYIEKNLVDYYETLLIKKTEKEAA